MISDKAASILKNGEVVIRVKRAGMYQQLTFKVRRIPVGNTHFAELFVDRVLNLDEIVRIANDLGLPVESQNGRAFPVGKGANDFIGL